MKAVLGSMGKRPSKRLGQNFLLDDSVLERAVRAADLSAKDTVLEIGPGLGNLTEELLRTGAHVVAVEQDPEFCKFLERRFGDRIRLVRADAVKAFLPEFNKVVSNLPYQISSKITYRLLCRPFDLAVLMFQREFAMRMTATAGSEEYGRLGMVVGFFCHAEILETIPRSAFRPVPEVNSAIVRLRPRRERPLVDSRIFMRLVSGLFAHRRKKVKKALAAMGVSKESMAGLDARLLEKRPEELAPDEAAGLAREAFPGIR